VGKHSFDYWLLTTDYWLLFWRELPRQNGVADPPAQTLVEREQGAGESGKQGLLAALEDQPHDPIHAFLHRPDAEGRGRRDLPRLAVGTQHAVAQGRVHKARRHHADVHAVAAQFQAQAVV